MPLDVRVWYAGSPGGSPRSDRLPDPHRPRVRPLSVEARLGRCADPRLAAESPLHPAPLVRAGIYFLLVVSVAGGLSTPRKAGSPGAAEAPWTKGMTATTCGDWLSVMTDRQRQAFAEALLAYDLSRPHGPALDQTTATEYASVITDTCRNDSPSSLVVS